MLRGDSQRRAPAQTPTQPAQPTSAAPATAPYEIRATIIARASYKGLCLKSLVQAFGALVARATNWKTSTS
ncbi:hypothetical protein HMPREF3192_01359 [Atopobium deltae]|uniref:Uncharacterized protein n=1 Tax=Atopobium deltae TaxID=1393034 RepID=A0A133XPY8_9ACTN|nr:hypothetical protein HMPREF3192_01359 [Atopobium deltae]